MIQNIITWVAGHLDQVFDLSVRAWLVVGIVLLFRLRVFRSASLANAPARRSGFSVVILAAIILLYLASAIMAISVVTVSQQGVRGGGVSTAPATRPAPATATFPASAPAARAAASTQPTRGAASTHPAATQTVLVSAGPDPSTTLHEQLLGTFSEMVPAIALVLISFRMVEGGINGWGLSLRKIPKGIGYGVLGFLTVFPILMFVATIDDMLIQKFQHRAEEVHETLKALSRPIPEWEQAIFILLAGVAAPLLEEIFFRGLVQTMLIQRYWGFTFAHVIDRDYRPAVWRRWVAILITSIFFASMHQLDHFPVIFLLSVSLGYLYERTGNMWANITLHALFNSTSMYFVLVGAGQ